MHATPAARNLAESDETTKGRRVMKKYKEKNRRSIGRYIPDVLRSRDSEIGGDYLITHRPVPDGLDAEGGVWQRS